jgi:sortase (surface protein transpeptidase)
MNNGRLFLFITTFILAFGIFLTPVTLASANYQPSNNQHHQNNGHDNNHNDKNNNKNKDKEYCSKHPNDPKCCPPVSVPEFGLIPGVFATLTSAGSFLVLKKRKN